MFNVDFKDIIFQLTPHFLRKDNFQRFMFSAIKPLKELNNNGVLVESFGQSDRINPSTTALNYDSTSTYVVGEFVKYLSITYQCTIAILVPESFDSSKWTKISNVNASLYQFILFIRNFLFFDARTIYLEKYLNDIYDPVSDVWDSQTSYVIGEKVVYNAQNYISLTANLGDRPDLNPADWETTGIEIVNDNTIRVLYLFNEAEQRDPVYFYNNWISTIGYVINDYIVSGNKVYKAIANNTNIQPPNAGSWGFIKDITFVFNFSDEFPFDYRIDIPLGITLQPDYSHDRIKSQIRLFNAAGRSFEGVEKGNITNQFFNSLT